MISLSEKAVTRVKEFIAQQPENYAGIRVSVEAAGCSGFQYAMKLEQESREGDQVVQVDGVKVFVDKQSMVTLNGTEIDYVESTEGAGFKFKNPNVSSTCGCGESFQV